MDPLSQVSPVTDVNPSEVPDPSEVNIPPRVALIIEIINTLNDVLQETDLKAIRLAVVSVVSTINVRIIPELNTLIKLANFANNNVAKVKDAVID